MRSQRLRYLLRAVRWHPIMLGGLVGLALGVVDRAAGQPPSPMTMLTAIVAIAVGAASVVDDHASCTLASSPTSLRIRSLHRLALALVVAVACWLPLALQAPREIALGDLALQLVTMTIIAVAAGMAAASRLDATRPAVFGALPPLVLAVSSAFLPSRATLLSPGGETGPPGLVSRWLLLAAAAASLLLWATRDPVRRTGHARVDATGLAPAGDEIDHDCGRPEALRPQ